MTEPEPDPMETQEGVVSPVHDETPPERYPIWGWGDVLVLAGLAIPVILITSVLTIGAAVAVQWIPRAKAIVPLSATFLFYALYIVLMKMYFSMRFDRPLLRSLGWVPPRQLRVSPLLWGVLTAVGAVMLGVALRTPEVKTPLDQLLADPVSIALMAVFAITLAPVFEELVFRGLLFPLIGRSLGPVAGAVLTALPFALLHGPEYAWSWQRVSIVFFAGFAFGWMRHQSGSTAAAAVMHAAYNGTFVLLLVISKYGGG